MSSVLVGPRLRDVDIGSPLRIPVIAPIGWMRPTELARAGSGPSEAGIDAIDTGLGVEPGSTNWPAMVESFSATGVACAVDRALARA